MIHLNDPEQAAAHAAPAPAFPRQRRESPPTPTEASPKGVAAARVPEQQTPTPAPLAVSLRTLALVIDRSKVRRALVNHRADPGRYAELVTLAELLVGLAINDDRDHSTDSTEIAVSVDPKRSSLLTVAEAAAVAGVTRAALYRAITEGRLTAARAKPYRIAPAALAAYLRRAA